MIRNYILICWAFSLGMVYYGEGADKLDHKEVAVGVAAAPVLFPVALVKYFKGNENETE